MTDLKERNIVMVSKDSEGVTTLDYPLTIPEQIEGLEDFIKKYGGKTATTLAGYGITDAKINNGVITLGNATITPITSLPNEVVKTNKQNTFTPTQIFSNIQTDAESMVYESSNKPTKQCSFMNVTADTIIDLTLLFNAVTINNSMFVYTCFIVSSASYTLTIKGQDKTYYIGSASDCAISSPAILLNVLCWYEGTTRNIAVSVAACEQ